MIALSLELGLAAATIGAELLLRWRYGLGTPPLYISDPAIGYLLAPNQTIRRRGNRIAINQYSMRSKPIDALPTPGNRRVLILGDSIVNGGWWTDQSQTLSSLLEQRLNQQLDSRVSMSDARRPGVPHCSDRFEVLNASANSWGPRNEFAYLDRFGHFGAEAIVLIINTDDLFAAAPTSLPVGRDRAYPSRGPGLALIEAAQRLQPNRPDPAIVAARQPEENCVELNRRAIGQIQTYAQTHNIPLILAMTPLKREVIDGPRDYELFERKALAQWTQSQQLPYLDLLHLFKPEGLALYQDHIHLNGRGNRLVIDQLSLVLRPYLFN
jgi:GDSL-like Lipase/Acylhydrolase family